MTFNRTIIMYFSPTGGTKRVAELIGKEFKTDDIYDNTVNFYDIEFDRDDLIVFCFPVYGGRVPKPIYDRFNLMTAHGTALIPVAVYGNRAIDDALLELSDIGDSRGFATVGGMKVVTRHSLNTNVGAGRPDADDISVISEFVQRIKDEPHRIPVRMPGHKPYKPNIPVPLVPFSAPGCMLCCTCAKECPTGAAEGPKSTNPLKCIACMRCVYVCPSDSRKILTAAKLGTAAAVKAVTLGRAETKYYL